MDGRIRVILKNINAADALIPTITTYVHANFANCFSIFPLNSAFKKT